MRIGGEDITSLPERREAPRRPDVDFVSVNSKSPDCRRRYCQRFYENLTEAMWEIANVDSRRILLGVHTLK